MTEPVSTNVEIGGNPGAYLIGADDDWESGTATICVSDCSHGGSIAQVEIQAEDFDGKTVSAFTELTPGDVDELIAVLTRIKATISPEYG